MRGYISALLVPTTLRKGVKSSDRMTSKVVAMNFCNGDSPRAVPYFDSWSSIPSLEKKFPEFSFSVRVKYNTPNTDISLPEWRVLDERKGKEETGTNAATARKQCQ